MFDDTDLQYSPQTLILPNFLYMHVPSHTSILPIHVRAGHMYLGYLYKYRLAYTH